MTASRNSSLGESKVFDITRSLISEIKKLLPNAGTEEIKLTIAAAVNEIIDENGLH